MQMYKVFFNDRLVCITEKFDKIEIPNNCLIIKMSEKFDLKFLIQTFIDTKIIRTLILYGMPEEQVFDSFCIHFELVKAAGGVVVNEKDEVLMIYRRAMWDLPKGKAESGESIEKTAIREVREETGLKDVRIKSLLTTTFHTYEQENRWIIKQTDWFIMNSSSTEKLIPEAEEGILDIKWVHKSDLSKVLINTYASIAEVITISTQKK
jgi:8-oxo-dGTP pyrophosphatase MutT (NUDIX family)